MSWMYEVNPGDNQRAAELVHALISEEDTYWNELKSSEKFISLVLNHDENISRGMREAFKKEFKDLCTTFNDTDCTLTQDQKNTRLNKYLCLLPLANIKPGYGYDIPELNKSGQWQLITYKVSPIELTPTSGFEALALADHDRLFAYGLTPMQDSGRKFNPQPHLIFMNPQYPTNQGYFTQLFLNFQSVAGVYNKSREKINAWLKHSTELSKTKTKLHGMGFEGKMAYMAAFDNESSQYISKIEVHDAHGLCDTLFTNYQEIWDKLQTKTEIRVQLAKNHYNLGRILSGWIATNNDGEKINNDKYYKSYWYNLAINIVLGNIVNLLLVHPVHYLVIPLCRVILQHKMELALMSAMIMIFMMLPGLLMTTAGITVTVFAAAYCAYKLIEPIKILFNFNEKNQARCHVMDSLEEKQNKDEVINDKLAPGAT